MPSHACQDHNAKGESDRGCAHRLATAPTKTRLCNRECCFQIGKGVNKNATSTAARPPPTREHEHEQSHTARSQALLQGSCHFLARSATTPTRSCTSCARTTLGSVHPSIHHPVTPLPAYHTSNPSHLDRDHRRSSCGTDTCDVLSPSLTAKALLTLTRKRCQDTPLVATRRCFNRYQPSAILTTDPNILCCRIWALPPPRLFGP